MQSLNSPDLNLVDYNMWKILAYLRKCTKHASLGNLKTSTKSEEKRKVHSMHFAALFAFSVACAMLDHARSLGQQCVSMVGYTMSLSHIVSECVEASMYILNTTDFNVVLIASGDCY